jgi:hypothetical protein
MIEEKTEIIKIKSYRNIIHSVATSEKRDRKGYMNKY